MDYSRNSQSPQSPMQEVHVIAQLADLKVRNYQDSLALTALIELLIEKQLITPIELQAKVTQLDHSFTPGPKFPIS
jgi:hypothetical protein